MKIRLLWLLLPIALVAIAAAMAFSASLQRTATARGDARATAATQLLTGVIDRETGMRGFVLTGSDDFLEPFRTGQEDADAARRQLLATTAPATPARTLLAEHDRLSAAWLALAEGAIARKRADGAYFPVMADHRSRKGLMDSMRRIDSQLHRRLVVQGRSELKRASDLSAALIVALTLLIGVAAALLVSTETRRRKRHYAAEIRYRVTQREFTDSLQAVADEPEAHALLKRHLELRVAGTNTTVLSNNNSDDRLIPTTPLPPDSPLTEALEHAKPTSCLAVRSAKTHTTDPDAPEPPLMTCAVCAHAKRSTCQPLLVSGKVIGSVLVEQDHQPDETHDRQISETVAQAAPVLANLRNLAIAERRASTDALTGLPNRRAITDALALMTAQASRNAQPLAAIALDLDHFKDVNDQFGHDIGDAVLAHVGQVLRNTIRASDLAGRQGGEEFIVLAPNTDTAGAAIFAENLRKTLADDTVPGLGRPVTASIGVAVLPHHAGNAETLLRLADRALYTAKNAGRNRVEIVDTKPQRTSP